MNEQQKQAIETTALHVRTARRAYKAAWHASVSAKDTLQSAAGDLKVAEEKYQRACDQAVSIDHF